MTKYGEGLGAEIVKAVNRGEIIEPITIDKVKNFCLDARFKATKKHMSVILSNSTENSHSPNFKKYFKRVGEGEYEILPEYRVEPCFYWLNVNSEKYDCSLSYGDKGTKQVYSNTNPDGSKRKNEPCFRKIKIGDYALVFETGKLKSITSICRVINQDETDNRIEVEFKKIKIYTKHLSLTDMKKDNNLKTCQTITTHLGTLFDIDKLHFDYIEKLLDSMNIDERAALELNLAVQESLEDTSEKRKKRLASRKSEIPEKYETTITQYKRNPDVIAEVITRANGICEKCKMKAPFTKASDGMLYLEVHHKKRLADGGEDSVKNAIAVCPNCHKKYHFG